MLAALSGGFAVVNISSGGQSGADTPEQAVEQFFDAVSDQDLVGVLEMLEPAERDLMVPLVRDLESDLSRLGLTESMNLSDVPGIDLEITNLAVEAEELQDGMSEVRITDGEVSYETLPEDIPLGEVLENLIEADGSEVDIRPDRGTEPLVQQSPDAPYLIAMENDGRWHVSLSFWIAELGRRDQYDQQELPALDGGVQAQGADSPEEAVQELAAAASDMDLERMVALLPPDSMRALQTYAPLFLEDAQADLDEEVEYEGLELDIQITDVETSSVDGGTRVIPTGISVTFSTHADGESTLTYDGDCFEATGALADEIAEDLDGDTQACWDDLAEEIESDLSDDAQAELEELMALFDDFEPGFVVVEVDGQHYIDPLQSFSDLLTQTLAGVERSDLEEGGILYRLFTGELELFDDAFEDDFYSDDPWDDDTYEPSEDPYEDDVWEDDDVTPPVEDPYDDPETWEDDDSTDRPLDSGVYADDEFWAQEDEWWDDFDQYELDHCFPQGISIEDCLVEFWEENRDQYVTTDQPEETSFS